MTLRIEFSNYVSINRHIEGRGHWFDEPRVNWRWWAAEPYPLILQQKRLAKRKRKP